VEPKGRKSCVIHYYHFWTLLGSVCTNIIQLTNQLDLTIRRGTNMHHKTPKIWWPARNSRFFLFKRGSLWKIRTPGKMDVPPENSFFLPHDHTWCTSLSTSCSQVWLTHFGDNTITSFTGEHTCAFQHVCYFWVERMTENICIFGLVWILTLLLPLDSLWQRCRSR